RRRKELPGIQAERLTATSTVFPARGFAAAKKTQGIFRRDEVTTIGRIPPIRYRTYPTDG
ncbi:MAG: hypothetical protein ABI771_13040, partial [Betaproteobacteria bacterium]